MWRKITKINVEIWRKIANVNVEMWRKITKVNVEAWGKITKVNVEVWRKITIFTEIVIFNNYALTVTSYTKHGLLNSREETNQQHFSLF